MKTKLIVLVLSAAIFGSSTAALARDGEGRRFEESRVQQTHQREWRGDRHHAKRHYKARKHDSHAKRHYKARKHDRHARSHRRDHRWSHHRQQNHHARRSHGRDRSHGRQIERAYIPALPHEILRNRLSIIFSGDF